MDLATGESVRVEAFEGRGFQRGLPAERPLARSSRVIDLGRDDRSGAYEVRTARDGLAPRRAWIDEGRARAERTVAFARRVEERIDRTVRWPTSGWAEARASIWALAPELRRVGFIPWRAGLTPPPFVAPAIGGRHLALLVCDARDRRVCGGRLLELAANSARAHVVIDVAPRPHQGRWPATRASQRAVCGESPTHREAVELVARLVAGGEDRAAETWIAALVVEWPFLALTLRAALMRTVARLRERQKRFEEAAAALRVADASRVPLSKCRPRRPRRHAPAGTLCSLRPRQEPNMYLLHAIPSVLQLIVDAEDELAALAGSCRWAREQSGAALVAFIGGPECRTVVIDGARGDDVRDEERVMAGEVNGVERSERPDGVSVVATVRYAGLRVGAVLVRADRAREQTATEAALALAALCAPALRARLDALMVEKAGRSSLSDILGRSPAMTALKDAICRSAVTPFPVLIEGESGTGKELVARAIHRLSPRRDRRFAAVNCAALSDELVDAELFGHARGAFTGAVGPRAGLFEEAHGGSLFLDEVGELAPRAQAKLLRAIQEREIRRLGENAPRAVDTRLIAATNRSLAEMVSRTIFREDLLFRLAVVRITLVPLRERVEDVPLLAHTFWTRMTREVGKRTLLGPDALSRLASHHWPGNVRELQNVMAGLLVLAPTRGRVGHRHVEQVLAMAGHMQRGAPVSLERARASCERRTVAAALARHAGRRSAAARELGLSRQGLTKAIRRLHLELDRLREGVA